MSRAAFSDGGNDELTRICEFCEETFITIRRNDSKSCLECRKELKKILNAHKKLKFVE